MPAKQRLYIELAADLSGLRTGLHQGAGEVTRFDGHLQRTGKSLVTLERLGGLAGIALATGFGLAVRETLALDKAMRNVNSISGMTEEALRATTDQVLQLSTALPQSASTLADGLYDIASSGFQGAEGMTVLNASAVAASAGLTDTAVSAKAITAVLNAYKLGAGEAADVSDILFSTVNLGVISFEQLAHNIGDYIGTAQALGVSFDETGAAIATMTLNGITATQSGTALNSVLAKLIKPGEGLKKVLNELGYESGSAAIEALGLRGTLMAVTEATGGTAEGMSAAFDDINALRGALALTSGEGANYQKVSAQITDESKRAGAAQAALAEQSKAVSYQFGVLRNKAMAGGVGLLVDTLPVVVKLLEGVEQGGEAVGDVLGDVGRALGPSWENLAEILRDSWQVFTDLAEVAGPVAGALGALAVGGTVETLNLLTEVLSVLVGLLADNQTLALALAIGLGVHLLGGVSALTVRLQVGLVAALYHSLTALGAVTAGAAGTRAALMGLVATIAPLAALAIPLAAGILAWGDYRGAVGGAKDALASFNTAMDSGAIEEQVAATQHLTGELDAMQARLIELDSRSWLSDIFDVGAAAEELGIRRSIDDVAEAAAAAEQDLYNLQGATLQWIAAANGMSGLEAFEAFGTAESAARGFADALPMLAAAGVVAGDSISEVQRKLDNYRASQEVGVAAADDMVNALGDIGDASKDTEAVIAELQDAIDRLMGVFLSADEAAIAFEDTLDALAESTKEHGRSLDINTEAGRANKSAIIDAVGALGEMIVADAKAGVGAEELSRRLETSRARLREAGIAAGFSAGEMDGLLTRYNLTPELVDTIVKAVGAGATLAEMQAVIDKANALDGKTATVTTIYRSIGMPGSAPVSRTVGVGGGVQQGKGSVLDFYAAGGVRENHVAQIAPAGSWRVWAEDETGGEAYIPLAASKRKRSVEIWQETGRRLNLYAAGGLNIGGQSVGTSGGLGLSQATAGMGSIPDLQAALAAWDRHLEQLAQAERRHELLVAVQKKEAGAIEALRAFDEAAYQAAEREAVEARIANIEALTRAQEEAARAAEEDYRLRVSINNNMFEMGQTSLADHLSNLDRRIARETEYTDEWMRLVQQRDQVEQADYQRRVDENNARFELGELTVEQHLGNLDRRLAKEEKYSDEWMALWRQREAVVRDAAEAEQNALDDVAAAHEKAKDAADKAHQHLMGLLEQERTIRADMAANAEQYATDQDEVHAEQIRAQADYFGAQADLDERYSQAQAAADQRRQQAMEKAATTLAATQARVLADRRTALAEWARFDEVATTPWGNTADQLIRNAQAQLQQFEQWTAALSAARARGVSEAVIAELGLDEGPKALGQLEQLNKATLAQIEQLNSSVVARTAAAGQQVALEQERGYGQMAQLLTAAQQAYADEVLALEAEHAAAHATAQEEYLGALADLQAKYVETQAQLTARLGELQTKFEAEQTALVVRLGQIGMDQGQTYGQSIADGVLSKIPAVQSAVSELQGLLGVLASTQAAVDAAQQAAAKPSPAPSGAPTPGQAGTGSLTGKVWVPNPPNQPGPAGRWVEPGYSGASTSGRTEQVTKASIPDVRVYIGDRELTDIVDVQVGSTLTARKTASTLSGVRRD